MLIQISQEEAVRIIQAYLENLKIEITADVFAHEEQDGEIVFCFGTPLEELGGKK